MLRDDHLAWLQFLLTGGNPFRLIDHMPEILEKGFTLGDIEVKPKEGVLVVAGQPRHVEPKAMDVLLVLAKAGDTVVSRQLLTAQVWPRGFVTDDALNRCISNLRTALGDDARTQRFIATVPRRGYRLACLLQPRASNPDREAILVLPFQHLSSTGNEYLSDGLTELLIARLATAVDRPVISRTTAMTFKNRERDLQSIRAELGISWVVEGSVMQLGDQVQVVVQLIDARTDTHAWADTWTRPLADTLTLLNEISRQVTVRICTELQPDPKPTRTPQTLPTELLRHYLHGLHLISRRSHDALHQSVNCFEKVLEHVPDHAPSLASLAFSWVLLAHYGAVPVSEGFDKGRDYANCALQAGPQSNADAMACLAAVEFFYDWDFQQAQETVERALEINPSHEIALLVAADINLVNRNNERAQHFMDHAISLDPLNTGLLMNAGDHLILQNRFGEAASALATALQLDPDFRPAQLRLALACAFDKRAEEALESLEHARKSRGPDAFYYEYQAIVCGRLGALQEARAAAVSLQNPVQEAAPWALARAWLSAGDIQLALCYLQSAYEQRSSSLPFLGITPIFEPIRHLPEVVAIMQKAKLH